jgi:hypothetical protein
MHSNLDTLHVHRMDDLRPSTGAHGSTASRWRLPSPGVPRRNMRCTPQRGTADSLKNNRNRHGILPMPRMPRTGATPVVPARYTYWRRRLSLRCFELPL